MAKRFSPMNLMPKRILKSLSEMSALGSTGYQLVTSGNLPEGTSAASRNHPGAGFVATSATIPVGRLPTGAGRLPAPPNPQTGSIGRRFVRWLPVLGWIATVHLHAAEFRKVIDGIGYVRVGDSENNVYVVGPAGNPLIIDGHYDTELFTDVASQRRSLIRVRDLKPDWYFGGARHAIVWHGEHSTRVGLCVGLAGHPGTINPRQLEGEIAIAHH